MKIDVSRLLDLEYLKGLVSQLNMEISVLKSQFIKEYDLDTVQSLDINSVLELFNQYECSCENIIQLSKSVFIDSGWEYADLFLEDVANSMKLKAELISLAMNEVTVLNRKIISINKGVQRQIDKLMEDMVFIDSFVKVLDNDGVVLDSDIVNLNKLINDSELDDLAKFKLSCDIVVHIISKIKVVPKKEEVVDVTQFENMLIDAYENVEKKDNIVEDQITEPTYSETVLSYYKQYKHLFEMEGFGTDLGEVMKTGYELSGDVIVSYDSMAKEHFCIKLASLLYELNKIKRGEKVEHDDYADLMMDLDKLEKIYIVDNELKNYKKELSDNIESNLSIIGTLDSDCEFKNKVQNRLRLLQIELKNNLISKKRKTELDLEYKNIMHDVNKLPELMKQIKILENLNNKIVRMLSIKDSKYGFITEKYYTDLNNLQLEVLRMIDMISLNGPADDMLEKLGTYDEIVSKYLKTSKKVNIKSFVLFDVDKNNEPYVIKDLSLSDKSNLIDSGVLKGKLDSAFGQYKMLVDDLLLYGVPSIMKDSIPNYIDDILSSVDYNNEKGHPTGMVRIRPTHSSLVRFISQEVVLHPETEIYHQVVSILQEILPNVQINTKANFSLHLNFASAIKQVDTDSYDEAIKRYSRKGLLYKLFLDDHKKTELTDSECALLRDIILLSLDAYSKMEQENKILKFDIINQIGGKKKRG